MLKVLIIMFSFLMATSAQSELVKYIDDQGQIHFVNTDYQDVPVQYLDQIPRPEQEPGEDQEPGSGPDAGQTSMTVSDNPMSFSRPYQPFTDQDLIRSPKSCSLPGYYNVNDLGSSGFRGCAVKPIPLDISPPKLGRPVEEFHLPPAFFRVLGPGNDIIMVDVFGDGGCFTCPGFMRLLEDEGVYFTPRAMSEVDISDPVALRCLESCSSLPCVMINHRECFAVNDDYYDALKRIAEYELYHQFMIKTDTRVSKNEYLKWIEDYKQQQQELYPNEKSIF